MDTHTSSSASTTAHARGIFSLLSLGVGVGENRLGKQLYEKLKYFATTSECLGGSYQFLEIGSYFLC